MIYNICILAYGDRYTGLFLNNHLKSILDETNLPSLKGKHEVNYFIFSDKESLEKMGPNEKVNQLASTVNVVGVPFVENVHFDKRYDLLGKMIRFGVKKSLENQGVLTVFAADQVVAKGFFGKMLSYIEEGHGAVFSVPLRAAVEPIQGVLSDAKGALSSQDLFDLGYNSMHPLWNASHYEAAQFSRMPYTILWNSGHGLLARSFSVSPMIFRPTEAMRNVNMADYDLPSMCENPKWLENWDDCPVIGAEPLGCFYPPFSNSRSSISVIAKEFGAHLHKSQWEFIQKKFYYPNKENAKILPITESMSNLAVDAFCKSRATLDS